jgi:hypothetical protein
LCTLRAGKLLGTAETVGNVSFKTSESSSTSGVEHVQCLVDDPPDGLSAEQKEKATQFIRAHADVFSKSATDLGRNAFLPHRINTGDHSPMKQPLRRQPYAHLAETEKNVQEMLAAKIIEPTSSPRSSNVLLVRKKYDSIRSVWIIAN